jgi:hypothetical protein
MLVEVVISYISVYTFIEQKSGGAQIVLFFFLKLKLYLSTFVSFSVYINFQSFCLLEIKKIAVAQFIPENHDTQMVYQRVRT